MTVLTKLFGIRYLAGLPRVWIIMTFLGATVTGCTVGPDFETPASPAVARFLSPDEKIAPSSDAQREEPVQTVALGEKIRADWWSLFRSQTVNQLVKQAIAGNQSLESVRQRLTQAQEAIVVAKSALYPQLGLNASNTEEKQTAASFGLTAAEAPLPPSFNFFQVGPIASYTPDLFGQTHRKIEQQVALAEYQSDQLDAAYLTLTGRTVSLALQMAAVQSQLKAVNDILAIDRQNVELVRRERQAGTVPDSDVRFPKARG